MDGESLRSDTLVSNQQGRILYGAGLKPVKNISLGQIWTGNNLWPFFCMSSKF